MAGLLLNGPALAQNKAEQGSIDITAKIISTTCALNLDSTASTTATAAQKTIDFGTFSIANVTSLAPTSKIGQGVPVVLSLKEATGSLGCAAIGSGKWDVSIDLPATAISTTNLSANHTLNNTTTTGAATGVAARLTRATNAGTAVEALLANKVTGYGYLVSGSTTGPNLNSGDTVTLTAELYKLTSGALAAGTYTANVPLTVVYK